MVGKTKSTLEQAFLTYWGMLAPLDIPVPQQEHMFHPTRRWRFDFAWPDRKIAVELEGGTWMRGAHVRGTRYAADCEKYNAAADLGWSVYRYTTDMLESDPAGCIGQVAKALRGCEELPFTDGPEYAEGSPLTNFRMGKRKEK